MSSASAGTLCGHEVSKVPDEFPNEVLRSLLIKHLMVVLQDYLLILLREHHRWILTKRNKCLLKRRGQWLGCQLFCVRSLLQHELPALRLLHIHFGWWASCTFRASCHTRCWAGGWWPPHGRDRGTRRSNCLCKLRPHKEPGQKQMTEGMVETSLNSFLLLPVKHELRRHGHKLSE